MLSIAKEPTFTRTVKALVPTDSGHEEQSFKATFRVKDTETLNGFQLADPAQHKALVRTIVVKLDDLGDATGAQVDFSEEVFEAVLALPWALAAMTRTYFRELSKAPEGN